MNETIQFELVSPEKKLVSEPVTMAVIPGEEGEFGVGPNHTSIVASLQVGTVELYTQGEKQPRKIFISGGFADVTATNCTVLAEEAIDVATMDQAALEQQISNLNEDLQLASEAADKLRIEGALNLVKAKLSAVTGKLVF